VEDGAALIGLSWAQVRATWKEAWIAIMTTATFLGIAATPQRQPVGPPSWILFKMAGSLLAIGFGFLMAMCRSALARMVPAKAPPQA
jgi:MFS-type transporter involved in bile tolerance (Atg22 family)